MIKKKPGKGIPFGTVFRLSISDLIHEWVLTLCLVMAVAAVLSPLMILFGLKYGTIEVLRYRLVQDPRNREVRPMVSKSFNRDWFDKIRERPDIAFVVPTTRQISATVQGQVKGKSSKDGTPKVSLDIIPTSQGDRLIVENGATIPDPGQCVLTKAAATALGAKTGDTLTVTAKRLKGSRYEKGLVNLKISGVLSDRASVLKSIYVRLEILEAVESYKDGQAVPEYGWPGTTPKAYPLYDGVVVIVPGALNKIEEFKLINNTGFSKIEPLTPRTLLQRAGYGVSNGKTIYLLSTRKKPAGKESVQSIRYRLRGKGAIILPWVAALDAELVDRNNRPITSLSLMALGVSSKDTAQASLNPVPPWAGESSSGKGSEKTSPWRRIMLPEGLERPEGPVRLNVKRGNETLLFPIHVENPPGLHEVAFIPTSLAGILKLFQRRNITYDEENDEFVLSRRGYAGFRLYAATIDDVDGLRKHFEEEGIPVHTEAERIRDVMELDTYLTLIFWLIAAVGLVGGVAALMSSLYASVERKRRELGVLRLLGLSGATLFRFPVYQGMLIAAGGFTVAVTFFGSLAWTINRLFQDHLQAGESLCRLSVVHLGAAMGATMLVAFMAGIVAAWRVTCIEPAEALRDE